MNEIIWDASLGAGTSLRGYLQEGGWPWGFEETVARLKALSGIEPAAGSDDYKTSVEFDGRYNGEIFTLYDYKADRALHIGGGGALDIDGLRAYLREALATVPPAPYEATEAYEGYTRHGWPR